MNKNMALVISLLLGVAAAALMFGYIKKSVGEQTAGWDMQRVLVAAEDLPAGTVLTEQNVVARSYPSKYVSERSILPGSAEMVIGGELLVAVQRGTPIMWTDIRPAVRTMLGLSGELQPGTRAVTVPVTQLSSFNGMLRPGMNVDLLWTGDASFFTPVRPVVVEGLDLANTNAMSAADIQRMMASASQNTASSGSGAQTKKTVLLLQNVPVLAIGDQRNAERLRNQAPDAFSTVTVMVPERDARVLVHAMSGGAVSLMLRQPGDATVLQGPVVMGPDELAAFLARPVGN